VPPLRHDDPAGGPGSRHRGTGDLLVPVLPAGLRLPSCPAGPARVCHGRGAGSRLPVAVARQAGRGRQSQSPPADLRGPARSTADPSRWPPRERAQRPGPDTPATGGTRDRGNRAGVPGLAGPGSRGAADGGSPAPPPWLVAAPVMRRACGTGSARRSWRSRRSRPARRSPSRPRTCARQAMPHSPARPARLHPAESTCSRRSARTAA